MTPPPAQGQFSPDGRWWWDGTSWRPVSAPPPAPYYGAVTSIYAGFWRRWAGAFIDGLVLAVPNFLIGFVLGVLFGVPAATAGGQAAQDTASLLESVTNWAVGTVIQWLYTAIMMSSANQATLGQMALGIRVTDLAGNRISFARATGRYFASFLSVLFCLVGGYLMMLFTERRQTLHDLVAGTVVVMKDAPTGGLSPLNPY